MLANANNVNESRHIGESDQWSPARQPRSLTTTRSAAAELSYHTKGDKVKEAFRAEYTSSTDEQTMRQHREVFLNGYTPTSHKESFDRSGNSRLNLHNSLTLKEPAYLYVQADYNYAHRDGSFNSAFDEWGESLTVSQRAVGMSEGTAWSSFLEAQGAFKVGSNNQRITYYAKVEHHNDEMEQARRYEQSVPISSLQHNSDDIFNRSTWGVVNADYSKEVGKDLHFGIGNSFFIRQQHDRDYLYHPDSLLLPSQIDALVAITDPANSYDSYDQNWSNDVGIRLSKRTYYTHPSFHVKIDYEQWALQVGAPLQHEQLHYQRGSLDTLASQTVFLPNISFRYRNVLKGGLKSIQFGISNNSSRTLLTDRIDFRDDSQPLIVKLGNPDLKPSMQTKVDASYYDQTAHNKGTYQLGASFDYHHRDVAQSLAYDPLSGIYTYKPMNVSGAYVASTNFSTHQSIGEKRYWTWHVNAGVDWTHAKDHTMLAGETASRENTVNTLSLNSGGNIRFNRKTLNVRAVGYINWRHSEGLMYDFTTLNALDFQYGMEAYYITPALWGTKLGGLTLSADGTMFSRRGYGSAELDRDDFVVNASLSQPVANGRLNVRLQAFDLLHQLSPTDYAVNAQGRTVTWYRSLPHYVMLHLVYHWNRNPKSR